MPGRPVIRTVQGVNPVSIDSSSPLGAIEMQLSTRVLGTTMDGDAAGADLRCPLGERGERERRWITTLV